MLMIHRLSLLSTSDPLVLSILMVSIKIKRKSYIDQTLIHHEKEKYALSGYFILQKCKINCKFKLGFAALVLQRVLITDNEISESHLFLIRLAPLAVSENEKFFARERQLKTGVQVNMKQECSLELPRLFNNKQDMNSDI